jgi:superfamily II DNA or RNA helicase
MLTPDFFKSPQNKLSLKSKGDNFEKLTYAYFKLEPKYQFYDEVWLYANVPTLVLEELGLPKQDIGIDLIAKNGNEYHAIQCKYHEDNKRSVTFREVSTFISLLESTPKITQGYICSTADLTSRVFNKLNTKPINLILNDTWQSLSKEFFENADRLLNGKKERKLTPFKPRPHQVKALKEAKKYFLDENNTRGKLIFPCGAGKSLTGYWITEELKSKSTIIAVPSLSLVKQTLDVYLREISAKGKKVNWLCICSDEGIGKDDDVAFFTENLGVPCQTDPIYIKKWLSENADSELVVFTTYQSGRIIAEVAKSIGYKFDLGIFDEAHKTVGSGKKLFSHLLFEENISIQKRIFMTATERFYAGSKEDIISMDDEEIYGDTFTHMSFKEAIETGLLTDYKVVTIDIQKSEIASFIQENNLVQLNDKWKKETEARSLASMLALRKAMKVLPIKNAVSFHSSIEKAVRNKELQQYITETYHYKPIDTFTVSGKQPTTQRNIVVQEFASSPNSLITNARCLTEGVDVPNIDCIVFSDPRKSKVDIVQALGRALRKKEGKEWGYVILPVIYDDITHEIDNENFQEILAVVRGLASNDERIVEYFKDKADPNPTSKQTESQFHLEVFSEYMDEAELSSQLQIKLWDKLSTFKWLDFADARKIILGLGIKSNVQWREYSKSKDKPSNIPSNPDDIYKHEGWISWGDWLGNSNTKKFEWLPFEDAKSFIKTLNLKSQKEWRDYTKSDEKPENIPVAPNIVYKNKGWISFSDWLGYDYRGKNNAWLSFESARHIVRKIGMKSSFEWEKFSKSEEMFPDIPKSPHVKYKNEGWISWADWLGNSDSKNFEWLPFEEAKKLVKTLNLKSQKEWRDYTKSDVKPANLPNWPNDKYKNEGWISWGDWLGTGSISNNKKQYLPFNEARNYVHTLKLKGKAEWDNYCRSKNKLSTLPNYPNEKYAKTGWINWGDWLGTGKVAPFLVKYRNFEDAKSFVKKLGLNSQKEWFEFYKSEDFPSDLPRNPSQSYKDKGWQSWGDWLGTGRVATFQIEFRNFEDANSFVKKLGLNSQKEWIEFCKSEDFPNDLPRNPNQTYKNKGWQSWSEWLGSSHRKNINYISFIEAKDYVKTLGLNTFKEWMEYRKSSEKPNNIPSNPNIVYKDKGWIGYADFLGKNGN